MRNRFIGIDAIEAVQNAGYTLYTVPKYQSWGVYTDGDNIASVAVSDFGGYNVSTIHKQNITSGVGFRISDGDALTPELLRSGFALAPNSARPSDVRTVTKFKSPAAYFEQSWCGSDYVEVPPHYDLKAAAEELATYITSLRVQGDEVVTQLLKDAEDISHWRHDSGRTKRAQVVHLVVCQLPELRWVEHHAWKCVQAMAADLLKTPPASARTTSRVDLRLTGPKAARG